MKCLCRSKNISRGLAVSPRLFLSGIRWLGVGRAFVHLEASQGHLLVASLLISWPKCSLLVRLMAVLSSLCGHIPLRTSFLRLVSSWFHQFLLFCDCLWVDANAVHNCSICSLACCMASGISVIGSALMAAHLSCVHVMNVCSSGESGMMA